MDDSKLIFLFSDKVLAVRCIYDPDCKSEKPAVFKTFDRSLKKGDLVIVQTNTRHGMTVFKVDEVDYDIDVESKENVRWIIGKVDKAEFELVLAQEAEMVSKAKAAQRRAKRDELAKKMAYDAAEEIKDLSNIGGQQTLAPPTEDHDTVR